MTGTDEHGGFSRRTCRWRTGGFANVGRLRVLSSFALFIAVLAFASATSSGMAETPKLSQMVHMSWTARDGSPQAIEALAQGPDGALWIGSDGGLFRFDGISFQEFQPSAGEPRLPSNGVLSLCALPDGTLWVGMFLGGVARIVNGHVTLYTKADGQPLSTIDNIRVAPDGSIWALNNRGSLIRFAEDGMWHQQQTPLGPAGGRIFSFFIDRSSALWVPQANHLYRRASHATSYVMVSGTVDFMVGASEAEDGSIWIADIDIHSKLDYGRLQHLDHTGNLIASLSPVDEAYRILYASDGSLWLATQFQGVLRLRGDELRLATSPQAAKSEDRYRHVDGLSANSLTAIFVDSDGNIWTGSKRGLDRFNEAIIRPFSMSTPEAGWSLCSGPNGVIWIASDKNELYRISGQAMRSFPNVGDVYSINCAKSGEVFLMDHAGLWTVDHDRLRQLPPIPGAGTFAMRQVVAMKDGTLFAGGGGLQSLWSLKEGQWVALPGPPPLDQGPAALFIDSQERLWTGYKDGRIGLPLSGQKILLSGSPGLGVVHAFLESTGGMLVAGMNGVARLRRDSFTMLVFADKLSTRGITGIVQSRDGDLWLNGSHGIVRVRSEELAASWKNPAYEIKSEVLNEGDFKGPSRVNSATPSATRDSDGKLWFSMLSGAVMVDPGHLHLPSHLPSLAIHSMSADGITLGDNKDVAPKPQTILIRYLGVNLTAPEKVMYRYRLDGLDDSWQEAGHRTEAIYTHLKPGKYTFRVVASNGGGTWTSPVSSSTFTVLPSYYQTWWFLSSECALSLLGIWLVLHMRVRYLAEAIRIRFKERADERVRIARDLHDTLLQGVQGLMMTFHVAAQRLTFDQDSRLLLERALTKADAIIVEGRDRVNRLRAEPRSDADLLDQIRHAGEDLKAESPVTFSVNHIGLPRALQPHTVDESFYIIREALTNAFRHSHASAICVSLDYQERCLVMCCSDDGIGFDQERGERASKAGHWGLKGMIERTEKIGGRFACTSSGSAGTQICVSVPSRHAYIKSSSWISVLQVVRSTFISMK